MEVAELEEGSDDSEDQRIKSVVGTDGLKEFVMLPEWTVSQCIYIHDQGGTL